MALKRTCISDTGEESALHMHCSGLWETKLGAIHPGERSLSQDNSFSGNMILKSHALVTLGKPWLCMVIVQVSQETELEGILQETDRICLYTHMPCFTLLLLFCIMLLIW